MKARQVIIDRKQYLLLFFVIVSSVAFSQPVMKLLAPAETQVYFRNDINETSKVNVMIHGQVYAYNGGGVAVGDLDNDGWEDLFFTANSKGSTIYKNLGKLKFEDRTKSCGVTISGWCTGVTMADVNNDGLLDIYICKSRYPDSTAASNQLLINKGNFKFEDQTRDYGLFFNGNSIQGTFFDYDKDGDLDFYLLVHPIENPALGLYIDVDNKYPKIYGTDQLYENLGGQLGFVNATNRLGISGENAFGLGVIAADLDNDNLVDIYVSNDFVHQDFFYKNLGTGYFKECLYEHFAHTSYFSMGVDVNDFNNDGLPDLVAADMSPQSMMNKKQQMNGFNYNFYQTGVANHGSQNVWNSLQMNKGKGQFSEIANYAGVAETDWSWSPLFADIDLDGKKDLIISNGIKRDILNQQFYLYTIDSIRSSSNQDGRWTDSVLLSYVKPYRSANLFYKNLGQEQFKSNAAAWGIADVYNSSGSAYADLDHDGDLDFIFNNTDTFAAIYQNLAVENKVCNWVALDIKDADRRPYGTKIICYQKNQQQYQFLTNARGYQSKSTDVIHFGLGDNPIDSMQITWPDNTFTMLIQPTRNSYLKIDKQKQQLSFPDRSATSIAGNQSIEISNEKYSYKISKSRDFTTQPLLYKSISDIGPAALLLSKTSDVLLGSYMENPLRIISMDAEKPSIITTYATDSLHIDFAALEIDLNNDRQKEILISSGSFFFYNQSNHNRISAYSYSGNQFKPYVNIHFPLIEFPIGKIVPIDYDQDGDLDLFLAAAYSYTYPNYPQSYLWENKGNGNFVDRSKELLPSGGHLGNIKDVSVADVNLDDLPDLVLLGEWMPIRILSLQKTKHFVLNDVPNTAGMWQSIDVTYVGADPHPVFLLGNMGLNSRFLLDIHANKNKAFYICTQDLNGDGIVDPLISIADSTYLEPIYYFNDFIEYFPASRKNAYSYVPYSTSSTASLFPNFDQKKAILANEFRSGMLVYKNDSYQFQPFENTLQQSSINDFCRIDSNTYMLVGNQQGMRRDIGSMDASRGTLLNVGTDTHAVVLKSDLFDCSKQVNASYFIDKKVILIEPESKFEVFVK